MVFGDRFNYTEMWDLLPGISGLSRQLVSHGSGLSRQVLLYYLPACPLRLLRSLPSMLDGTLPEAQRTQSLEAGRGYDEPRNQEYQLIIIYLKNLPILYHWNDHAISFYIERWPLFIALWPWLCQKQRCVCSSKCSCWSYVVLQLLNVPR